MPRSELTDIAAKLLNETDKAYLVFDGAKEVWLPKSLTERNYDGTYTIPEWLAKDKGLI